MVKNFGCWIADAGFPPPRNLADFLDGADLVDVRMVLVRQQSASLAHRAMNLDGTPAGDRGLGVFPAYGWVDADRTRLVGYKSQGYVSDVVLDFEWQESAGIGALFWTEDQIPLPVMPASLGQRVLAIRIGAAALARRAHRFVRRTTTSES